MHARPDEEYVEYVRARQGQLLRAAYLVRGDRRAAAAVLEASLRALARSWHRVRTEDPDRYVRRRLYREAVSSGRRDRDAPALLDLTPSQRALAALLLYEERTDAEAADALGWRVDKVRNRMERVLGRVRSAEALADRLRVLAEQLPEAEFAASSWAGAWDDLRRRRRTTAVSVAGLAVFGLLASGLVGPGRSGREDVFPAPTTAPMTETGGFKRTFGDVPYVVSPRWAASPGWSGCPRACRTWWLASAATRGVGLADGPAAGRGGPDQARGRAVCGDPCRARRRRGARHQRHARAHSRCWWGPPQRRSRRQRCRRTGGQWYSRRRDTSPS